MEAAPPEGPGEPRKLPPRLEPQPQQQPGRRPAQAAQARAARGGGDALQGRAGDVDGGWQG